MVLINVIAFAILKILHNLVSVQKILFASKWWSKKNYKKCPCDITFIFIELSETVNSFVKIRLLFEMKSIASFIKTGVYWKWGCIKINKQMEMF